ncbi:MAG: hypothetical protein COT73_10920 [Bdellovibrio sp. CG10_big_fil_rev_8_21_14_0_10_47_8]|nr:MAG: hypothetical protein COT73_10920 [Bdellovibrio sp. CG10_big_fil_rev_8_21_14_0_10_47_8]
MVNPWFVRVKSIGIGGLFILQGCSQVGVRDYPTTYRNPAAVSDPRGSVADYDAGPPMDSKWPDLFAETPNYRAYGAAIYAAAMKKNGLRDDNSEKFRWKVGPMWYRGRLTPDSVKVFVIGQEGAQDENTSNRTFTGSTGTKMQNFINYFGINSSYLFMNTFSYTITGQYGERPEATDSDSVKKRKAAQSSALYWLAQNPKSIVVQHRHKMFDYMLSQNKNTLALIVGVGTAGKDSLATWIRSHGGKCSPKQLASSFCDASSIAPGARAIGVPHPGAASARNGGSSAAGNLKVQFAKRAELVADWIKKDSSWMKPDPGAKTDFSKSYYYRDAVIPHRDFAFGSIWRLGKDGTTSNRRGADGIQVYSDAGCYNNALRIDGKCDFAERPKTLNVKYDEPKDLKSNFKMAPDDFPWESPKSKEGRRQYDMGPTDFADVLMGQKTNSWPNFTALGAVSHSSFGFGQIYRGHLDSATVLVLADQESHDDMFSTRALTGTGGQRLQTFLDALNVGSNYAIIRTLPVDTLNLPTKKVSEIALQPEVAAVRKEIFDAILKRGKTKLVLTVGPVAAEAIKGISPGAPVINLDFPLQDSHLAQWKKMLAEIDGMRILPAKVGAYDGSLTAIPRTDLPAHTRWWMGTSGSRASRAYVMNGGSKADNGDYYKFDAPGWVNSKNYPDNASSMNADEKASVQSFYQEDMDTRSDVGSDESEQ